jgi:hypothetical protein
MNGSGAVAAYHTGEFNEFHAFLRNARGVISTIDPPGTGFGLAGLEEGELTGDESHVNLFPPGAAAC